MQSRPNHFQHLAQTLLHYAEQRESFYQEAVSENKLTLMLLQDLKAGNVSLDSLVVSDDGWQVLKDEEEPDDSGNGVAAEFTRQQSTPVG